MKIVFYKTLLKRAKDLTPTEKIIYSFLVSKSITLIPDFFNSDGTCLNIDEVYDYADDTHWIDLFSISIRKMANELNITQPTVINGMKKLRKLNYINGEYIFVSKELLINGYFELHRLDILSGQVLIFYSYIKHKAEMFGNSIDTFRSKLAETLGIKIYSINQYLAKLYKLNLIKRLENGKLMIL